MWYQSDCEVCGSSATTEYLKICDYNKYGDVVSDQTLFSLKVCSECNHYWVRDRLSRDELDRVYKSGAYRAFNSYYSSDKEARWKESGRIFLDDVINNADSLPGASLLEIGASFGHLLSEAKQRGFKVIGIEPSEKATSYAKQTFGLDIVNATIEDANLGDEAKFDIIVAISVLEHVFGLNETITKIKNMMNPGGLLYIEVPGIDTIPFKLLGKKYIKNLIRRRTGMFHPVEHVRYFSAPSMKYFLERNFDRVRQLNDPRLGIQYHPSPFRTLIARLLHATPTGNIVFIARMPDS